MKIFVLDTNVVLHDPYATTSFDANSVVIPMTVLEELDNIKSRKQDVSRDARVAIRQIANILEGASHGDVTRNGVKIANTVPGMPETAKLAIFQDQELQQQFNDKLPECKLLLDTSKADNRIINTALWMQHVYPSREVVLVTNDINMRIKAQGAGVHNAQEYSHDSTVSDVDLLHKGYIEVYGDFWEQIGNIKTTQRTDRGEVYVIERQLTDDIFEGCTVNDYVVDDEGTTLGRIVAHNEHTVNVLIIHRERAMTRKVWGISAKDKYQAMAINALIDPEIDLTVLLGPAGTGKTLITLAAALEHVIERGTHDKVIFSRSLQSQFEDIGFLPGNEHEKISPWAGGAYDALEYMHRHDTNPAESIKHIIEDRQAVQFKALNFIRGRSFQNTILVIDEAQNLTATQMKTIISRAGENTKVVLMGNLAQIDNDYVSALSSGLTYVTEKFKDTEIACILQLQGVVRSRLAEFAEQNL